MVAWRTRAGWLRRGVAHPREEAAEDEDRTGRLECDVAPHPFPCHLARTTVTDALFFFGICVGRWDDVLQSRPMVGQELPAGTVLRRGEPTGWGVDAHEGAFSPPLLSLFLFGHLCTPVQMNWSTAVLSPLPHHRSHI